MYIPTRELSVSKWFEEDVFATVASHNGTNKAVESRPVDVVPFIPLQSRVVEAHTVLAIAEAEFDSLGFMHEIGAHKECLHR